MESELLYIKILKILKKKRKERKKTEKKKKNVASILHLCQKKKMIIHDFPSSIIIYFEIINLIKINQIAICHPTTVVMKISRQVTVQIKCHGQYYPTFTLSTCLHSLLENHILPFII